MLTKDLLKVNLRKGVISPKFVDVQDEQALDLAKRLLCVVNGAKEKTQSYIEEALNDEIEALNLEYASGFVKLILDQMEYSEVDIDYESDRWDLIKSAQSLRQEQYFKNKEEFQESLATLRDKEFKTLSANLYADLPEFRIVTKAMEWCETDLIHRYNCGLVQSLLLLAPQVDIFLDFTNAVEKRNVFRAIKFHRLVVGNVKSSSGTLSFTIDGPLSLLVNTQAYGMRLANFFPRLLLLNHWKLIARVQYKKRDYELHLSDGDGLRSHYKEWGDYRPEEFEEFLNSFNKAASHWQAQWCDDLVPLGPQLYCFPDMTFVHSLRGQKVHMELFHRWHKGELEKRIKNLQNSEEFQVIIGVCNSLVKQANMGTSAIYEKDFEKFGFTFRGVPTPKAVNALLDKAYRE